MIIGSGGAGKSTLAKEVGTRLGLPLFHLDKLYWGAGWTEPDKGDWEKLQVEVCANSEWVIDGNYGGTLDVRLKACDTVIFLDLPRWLCLFRVLMRPLIYRNTPRPDMAEGCIEKLDFVFLKWIWDYRSERRPAILAKLEELEDEKNVYVLDSRRAVKEFAAALTR